MRSPLSKPNLHKSTLPTDNTTAGGSNSRSPSYIYQRNSRINLQGRHDVTVSSFHQEPKPPYQQQIR